jgi:hypothetical protein
MENLNICHYCGKSSEGEKNFHKHTIYQIISVNKFPIGYKYNSKDIDVPRCRSCYFKHEKYTSYVTLPLFIISTIGLSLVAYFFGNGWRWWSAILFGGFLSFFVASIISSIIEYFIYTKIFKIPRAEKIKNFKPIKELLDLNWQLNKKDPAVAVDTDIALDSPILRIELNPLSDQGINKKNKEKTDLITKIIQHMKSEE